MNITYDLNGNIYIDSHLLTITKDNDLELEQIINHQNNISDNITYDSKHVKFTEQPKKIQNSFYLHEMAVNDIVDTFKLNEEENHDIFDSEDTMNSIVNTLYNKEMIRIPDIQSDHSDTESLNSYDENVGRINYKIYGELQLNKTSDSYAMYETHIYQGDINSNNLIFRTEVLNDNPIFRILLYTDGYAKLNIIGTRIIEFKITKNELLNKFVFEKLKSEFQYLPI